MIADLTPLYGLVSTTIALYVAYRFSGVDGMILALNTKVVIYI